ncbi:MAG: sugar-binding protein [Lachnospiraceae bacterium]|nr:sugar-binding protein [Lachnospiraceae bacterium]
MKRFTKAFLGATLAVSMLAGCNGGGTGSTTTTGGSTETTTTTTTTTTNTDDSGSGEATTTSNEGAGKKVGVSMPTKDLQRWNQDGANMEKELIAAGYEVDLQYAANDVQQQLSQIENMIAGGCDVVVIAAIEGSSLGEALDMAKASNIPVIAYDRLLMNSDAVSYYATFDNYKVGTVQGTYVKDTLDLDNAAGPFNIEFTAGDPGDNNAGYFFNGAYDVLKPYIESGKLNVVSGQKSFDEVATPTWATDKAQSRAENILSSFYADGTNVDVWLCSNDSTALGVENALAANYNGNYPIITGQDCDIENTKNMIAGKQSMSVFKDTRTLASQVVKMTGQILKGETVDVNDTSTYDNGVITVPSFLCEPVFADANNYKAILIDSGYYTEDQLK